MAVYPHIEAARVAAADGTTSMADLAAIAQEYPSLQAMIANHPAAYEGLLDWIATYGDANAVEAVAARRMREMTIPPPPQQSPTPQAPVYATASDRPMPTNSESTIQPLVLATVAPQSAAPVAPVLSQPAAAPPAVAVNSPATAGIIPDAAAMPEAQPVKKSHRIGEKILTGVYIAKCVIIGGIALVAGIVSLVTGKDVWWVGLILIAYGLWILSGILTGGWRLFIY